MSSISSSRAARPAWITLAFLAVLLALPVLAVAQEGARTYSLDFVDSDLSDVVRALAAQSGANIALATSGGTAAAAGEGAAPAGGKTIGKVTVNLRNVTLEEALQVLSGLTGLDYAKVGTGSTYVMGNRESLKSLKATSYESRVVTLRLSQKLDYVKDVLKEVAPEVVCSGMSGTRSLLLVGPPAALDAAIGSLSALVGPDISEAETMVYEVRYAKCDELRDALMRLIPDLVVDLAPRTATPMVESRNISRTLEMATPQTSTSAGTPAAGAGFDTDTGVDKRVTDTAKETSPVTCLIISGRHESVAKAKDLLAQLDVAPSVITINTTITEIRNEEVSKLGIDWNGLGGTSGFTVGEATQKIQYNQDGSQTVTQPLVGENLNVARDLTLGRFQRSHLSIPATINALITKGKAKILSNGSISLLNGRQATIHSGETIYYPVVTGYSPLGGQIVSTEEIKTGVTLAVNPRVTPEGDIVMTLVPTVSDIAPSRFAGYPTIVERSVITTVRVKSGETIVLGGLIRDEMVETRSEVPFLSKLPLVGELFKSRSKSPRHSEVLIFMTPKVGAAAPPETPAT